MKRLITVLLLAYLAYLPANTRADDTSGITPPPPWTGFVSGAYGAGFSENVVTKVTALTESSATAVVSIAVASGSTVGGKFLATIDAHDATDFQGLTEEVPWAATNKAGTVTCTLGAIGQVSNFTNGTLTDTITCVASGNNVLIKQNAVSSLTQTTLNSQWTSIVNGTNVQTGQ